MEVIHGETIQGINDDQIINRSPIGDVVVSDLYIEGCCVRIS